ncbi:hypothetical protein [Paracoccus siganidrum]|nr:hypothetical protein [Paracoccus siganidrum]
MLRIYWHLMGRLYEARSNRALTLHIRFANRAEKFFRKLRGL